MGLEAAIQRCPDTGTLTKVAFQAVVDCWIAEKARQLFDEGIGSATVGPLAGCQPRVDCGEQHIVAWETQMVVGWSSCRCLLHRGSFLVSVDERTDSGNV